LKWGYSRFSVVTLRPPTLPRNGCASSLLRSAARAVIKKYVNVDPEAVQVNLEREDGHEVLELSVALPGAKEA
jgi:hypothetical protein